MSVQNIHPIIRLYAFEQKSDMKSGSNRRQKIRGSGEFVMTENGKSTRQRNEFDTNEVMLQ